jgi:hypothetical protein
MSVSAVDKAATTKTRTLSNNNKMIDTSNMNVNEISICLQV